MLIIVKTVKLCNPKVNFKRVRRDMCWCSLLIRSFPGKQKTSISFKRISAMLRTLNGGSRRKLVPRNKEVGLKRN